MILVIDDVKEFPFHEAGLEARYARTLSEAFTALEELGSVDELWLDHDLGGEATIRPVVRALEERAFHGDPMSIGRVVICSLNSVGAAWIASSLDKYYPIGWCTTPDQLREHLGHQRRARWY